MRSLAILSSACGLQRWRSGQYRSSLKQYRSSLKRLAALIRSLAGTGFEDRRDMAIARLFLNTGARLEEMSQLRLEVVSLQHRELYVMGKGRKARVLPLGAKAVKDLDRYLRVRERHKEGHLPWLWLSSKGRLTSSGIAQMIKRRCKAAGIPAVHPHQFRHTPSRIYGWSGVETSTT